MALNVRDALVGRGSTVVGAAISKLDCCESILAEVYERQLAQSCRATPTIDP